MPYACFRVVRANRRDRADREILASGLTIRAASDLAAMLRRGEANDAYTVGVETMPLGEQAAVLAEATSPVARRPLAA